MGSKVQHHQSPPCHRDRETKTRYLLFFALLKEPRNFGLYETSPRKPASHSSRAQALGLPGGLGARRRLRLLRGARSRLAGAGAPVPVPAPAATPVPAAPATGLCQPIARSRRCSRRAWPSARAHGHQSAPLPRGDPRPAAPGPPHGARYWSLVGWPFNPLQSRD